MKSIQKYINILFKVNGWNKYNTSIRFFPGTRNVPNKGVCYLNTRIWIPKIKDKSHFKVDAFRRTEIDIYANADTKRLFLALHEIFHFLKATKQLKKWRESERQAHRFALINIIRYWRWIGMVDKCPECKSTNIVVKYRIQAAFATTIDLENMEVIDAPFLTKLEDPDFQGFEIVCENCGEEIDIDDEQKQMVMEMLNMYDYGVRK